ncbi:MAG: hypothetical protein ACLP9L_33355 [Thermoguttaceae bacterium]
MIGLEKEQYHFSLRRPGFQPKNFARASGEDNQAYTVSEWEPVIQGLDWPQDFEAAKKAAADDHKNVLILFDASDSNVKRFAPSVVYVENLQEMRVPGQ